MVYNFANKYGLLVGGKTFGDEVCDQLLWINGQWVRDLSVNQIHRYRAMILYIQHQNLILLYGGQTDIDDLDNSIYLYKMSNSIGHWTHLFDYSLKRPIISYDALMNYDGETRQIIMYGGYSSITDDPLKNICKISLVEKNGKIVGTKWDYVTTPNAPDLIGHVLFVQFPPSSLTSLTLPSGSGCKVTFDCIPRGTLISIMEQTHIG
jgi:hypothetical protein